jgi:hypothetical protein
VSFFQFPWKCLTCFRPNHQGPAYSCKFPSEWSLLVFAFWKKLGVYLRYTITSSTPFLLLSLILGPAGRADYQDCNHLYVYTHL